MKELKDSVMFSTFNMSDRFNTIPIAEQDQMYFAFTTPKDWSFAFCTMPYGWLNRPACYSRFLQKLTCTLPLGSCLSYVDEVLQHSKDETREEMLKLIEKF